MKIPSGKHKGKELRDLPDSSVVGMYGSWNDVDSLRTSEFFGYIWEEIKRRGLMARAQKSHKPPAKPIFRSKPKVSQRRPKQGKKQRKLNAHKDAICPCGRGVKLAVFSVLEGKTFCSIECRACRKTFGVMTQLEAINASRRRELYLVEPSDLEAVLQNAKPPMPDGSAAIDHEYQRLMQAIL